MSPTNHDEHTKSGNPARELLEKVTAEEVHLRSKQFLAPYASDSKFVVVKMLGANYRFRIVGGHGDGFGIFQPTDPTCARYIKEADPLHCQEYLKLWPRLYLILVYQTDLGWCGYPHNVAAAKEKIQLNQEVIVHNVSDVERFDVVAVRYDGVRFWYEEPFVGADPVKAAQLRAAFVERQDNYKMTSRLEKIRDTTPEEIKSFELAMFSWRQFKRMNTEEQLQEMLEMGGAHLENYVVRGKNIDISWRAESGSRFNSLIDRDTFDVVSAGICLNDQDQKFHLKDLAGIIKMGEEREAIFRTRQVRGIDLDGQ